MLQIFHSKMKYKGHDMGLRALVIFIGLFREISLLAKNFKLGLKNVFSMLLPQIKAAFGLPTRRGN